MRGSATKRSLVLIAIVLALLSAGCDTPSVAYVDEGRSYTAEELLSIPDRVDPGELAEKPAAESVELRHRALVDLRQQGEEQAKAAQLLTATFDSATAGVPFYVERAFFESEQVTIVVESIGPPRSKLVDERVWVIDEAGEILLTGTR